MEDALDEVLAEHFRVLLQQQVEQAVFTQTGTGNRRRLGWIILWISLGAKSNIRSELCVLAHLFKCNVQSLERSHSCSREYSMTDMEQICVHYDLCLGQVKQRFRFKISL